MSAVPRSLEGWTTAFDKLDYCPWIGPRPLTEEDYSRLLVGREKDLQTLLSRIMGSPMLILTADSAAGKTSLINRGLVPLLRSQGFKPLVCRQWIAPHAAATPESLVVAGILRKDAPHKGIPRTRSQVPREIDLSPEHQPLCEQLDKHFGPRAVLILDQFEELIRYGSSRAPHAAVRYHDFVTWLVEVNKNHATHLVLSLRKEHEHQLKPIETGVRGWTLGKFDLDSVTSEEAVREIIDNPAPSTYQSPEPLIEPNAINLLTEAWARSLQQKTKSSLGLLDVRATLYVLHDRAHGETVTANHVAELSDMGDGNPFLVGLKESASIKLRRCEEAAHYGGCVKDDCRDNPCHTHRRALREPLDPYLVNGARAFIQRALPHLSSADYKVPIVDTWLVAEALDRELRVLEIDAPKAEASYRTLARLSPSETSGDPRRSRTPHDLLTMPTSELEQTVGQIPDPEKRESSRLKGPSRQDPGGVSSGPMLGQRPSLVLVEETRRAALAVEWLRVADLIRVTAPECDPRVITLIHDGFGPALTAWATAQGRPPAQAIHYLTAARGETFDWGEPPRKRRRWPELDGTEEHRMICNVRWKECHISASFRRVIFLNCDFRGSRFDHCHFTGVAFVNCVLDGVTFSECTIHGRAPNPSSPEVYAEGEPPSFVLPVTDDEISALAPYGRVDRPIGNWLYSRTAGVPARPWSREDKVRDGIRLAIPPTGIMIIGQKGSRRKKSQIPFEPPSDGMMMIGGRLCSLMFYRCEARNHGEVALWRVSGAGLDIVEHEEGRFEIFGGKIRGLSITRDKDPLGDDREADPNSVTERRRRPVNLAVTGCFVTNVTLGDGLKGRADFTECRLYMLLNLNGSRFPVEVESCRYHSLVNVRLDTKLKRRSAAKDLRPSTLDETLKLEAIEGREDLAGAMEPMNYKLRPERSVLG